MCILYISVFLIFVLIFLYFYPQFIQTFYNQEIKPQMIQCQRPPTTQEHAWYSKAFLCPPSNGSYQQCTNHYIPTFEKENCDPMNRTYEMCPYPYAISEACYYKNTTKKEYETYGKDQRYIPTVPLHYEPVENPNPDQLVRNGMFFTSRKPELLLQHPIYTTPPAPM
jgi:hypothetical protein